MSFHMHGLDSYSTLIDPHLAPVCPQALRLMGSDEADREFGGEVSLESTVYWWHEKYKPRKPKYFNRVHTGASHSH